MPPTRPAAFPSDTTMPFHLHLERSVQQVRGALTDLLTAVGADASAPQVLARRFGVNKNLAWKACRIVNSSEAAQVVQHLPGAAGLGILLEALERRGAPMALVQAAHEALAGFDAMVAIHAGDRASLELMLGSLQAGPSEAALPEASRRLAFQGNSAVFGVQARTRIGAQILAPSARDATLLDVAILGGLLGFRRLRPNAPWPLAREMHASDHSPAGFQVEPIDPAGAPGAAPLVREFSSGSMPPIDCIPVPGGTVYEVREGRVGNTGALSCVFGWILRCFAPVHGVEGESRGEYFLRLDVPAERVLFDLLVHRDLPLAGAPELDFYSLMQGHLELPLTAQPNRLLPRVAAIESLGAGPPVLASPHSPRHAALLALAAARLGRELGEFRGYRLNLTYPPIPSLAVFHYELPPATARRD